MLKFNTVVDWRNTWGNVFISVEYNMLSIHITLSAFFMTDCYENFKEYQADKGRDSPDAG